jgi:AmmeMemoRadiSam system protein A
MNDPRRLLEFARASITERLGGGPATAPVGAWFDQPAATFVTLYRDDELHGCMGTLMPHRRLADDVRHNALAAAFIDPRAVPLAAGDLARLRIEISHLSALEPLAVASEAEARAALRPGVDGVVLSWGGLRGTFLPQVWDALPDPRAFLDALKVKAGLPRGFWSPDIALERYGVQKYVDDPFPGREASPHA